MVNKILLISFFALINLSADFYALKPIKITNDISCVIGDINPPMKENNGFVSNMCYINIGDSIVVLDSGPTYNFAKELHNLIKKEYANLKISHVILSNYHDDRTQRDDVKKAYDEDIEIFEVKNYVKTKRFNYLKHFEQLNSANISTYYNQLEWE